MWLAWCKYRYEIPNGGTQIINQVIWYNSHIRVNNKPIFYNSWYQKGIIQIRDIYNAGQHHFYTFQELHNLYGPGLLFLDLFTIIAGIPPAWKQELINYHDTGEMVGIQDVCGTSKEIYRSLVEKYYLSLKLPNYREMWPRDIGREIQPETWKAHYGTLGRITFSTKLRYFQYRFG